jgi:photosystem II stability/assembly factor-like uncharacterized protein
MLVTSNGGRTWRQQLLPAISTTLSGVSCPAAQDCVAVGSQGSGTAAIFTTTNGGSTWTAQTTGATDLWAVSCPTTSDCWAVGGFGGTDGEIDATTDGGTTWVAQTASNPLYPIPGDTYELHGVSCPTTTDCWASGGIGNGSVNGSWGVMEATSNGGSTPWATERLP